MEKVKERSELDLMYMWDLSKLFTGIDDWEKAYACLDEQIAGLAEFRGKLNNPDSVAEYFHKSTEVEREFIKVYEYAMLRRSEDARNEEAGSMFIKAMGKYGQLMGAAAFAEPELLGLTEDKLKEITESDAIKDYKFIMTEILKKKPHTLSASEEKLLAGFTEGFRAPGTIYENLKNADLKFEAVKNGAGEETALSEANYIYCQSQNDRVLRENSFRSYYKTLKDHENTFAAIYQNAVSIDKSIAAARNYRSAREMYMSSEDIPEDVYDNLIAAVRKYLPAMHRYTELRKKALGLDELHYYDLYAPLISEDKKSYTYDEAKKMVLDAVSPLGKDYTDTVQKAYDERWIDVYPNVGKRGGAFSAGCYDSDPYILLNFSGTLDSVSTLAHEMGHSMHSWYSRNAQPPQYADYKIFVAEVASTVNENLLTEQLLEKADDPKEKMMILNHYLEGFKSTVYRQVMFAEFEMNAHKRAEEGQPLTLQALNSIYAQLVKDYFGPALTFDEEVAMEWMRIPHFYTPFYVYKYATGFSAAAAISEMISKEGEPAVKCYKEFLSMGGSASPLDELKHAGVDLSSPEPIERALKKFEKILEAAEELLPGIQ